MKSLMRGTGRQAPVTPPSDSPPLPVLAPVLMMVFWMLLGGASGIRLMQGIWRSLNFDFGAVAIAVPVGGTVGALAGALLGLITNPRSLVLLMAVFAGSAAGGVAGQLPWDDVGEIGGQVAGGLVGGFAWAAWLFLGRNRRMVSACPSGSTADRRAAHREQGTKSSDRELPCAHLPSASGPEHPTAPAPTRPEEKHLPLYSSGNAIR